MMCSLCENESDYKCLVCGDCFCEEHAAKHHLTFFSTEKIPSKNMKQIKENK